MEAKISIIMGVYNCEETLPASIDSILSQTYDRWEFIICDDCSNDSTYAVLQAYKEKYPDRFRILKNEENRKLAYSLNQCLKYADGQYIARMDGDDISLPERLEKQVRFLREHPDIDLVGTAMQRFNDDEMADIVPATEHPDYYCLRRRMPFHHATILAKREVYEKLKGYTVAERTMRAQDYDLWFRFFHSGFRGANIQEPLYLVRENVAAIRRRTFKVRRNAFKTTVYGFRLLGYPKWWLIEAGARMIFKSLIPYRAMEVYRSWQKHKES